tara:strand:+ start:110 stop:1015 length:906 start_codon:yes stop_codon:yes gene_type:complete
MAITTYATLRVAVQNWLDRASDTVVTNDRTNEFIKLAEDRIANDPDLRLREMEAQADLVLEATVDGKTAGGTANTLTATPTIAFTSVTLGDSIKVEIKTNNTGAATLNVSGLGNTNIRKGDGGDALEAADLVAGHVAYFYFDGTQWRLTPPGGVPLPSRYVRMRRVYIDGDPRRTLEHFEPYSFHSTYAGSETSKPKTYTIEGEYIVFGGASDSSYSAQMLYYRRLAAFSADGDKNNVLLNKTGLYLYGSLIEAANFIKDNTAVLRNTALYEETRDRISIANRGDRHSGSPLIMRSNVTKA